MIERKKRLRFFQITLLIFGILLIYLTYYNKEKNINESSIFELNKKSIENQVTDSESEKKELFFNIEYSGLDLNGNRYLLKSSEAYRDKLNPEIINMKIVEAIFRFKDDTVLYVWADEGIYNNKTLDMRFERDVKANYLDSKLYAEKAEYSNTKNYLSIYENVRINDIKGNLIADKLLFDIKKQKLDITSFNNGKINANVRLDEKGF
tara:strand:+ start:1121 stop:1741 length:621 start_codon:yes stop_codon:yes gene_type:complete